MSVDTSQPAGLRLAAAVFLALVTVPVTAHAASVGIGRLSNVVSTDGGCVVRDALPGNSVESWDVGEGKTYRITLTNVTDAAHGGTDATMQVIVHSSQTGNQC